MPSRTFSPFTRRDFLKQSAALATAGGILLPRLTAQDAKFVTAETIYGKIRGVDNNGIKIFKGIPYGASTSGANRFMAPVEPAKWAGVRDALAYGHSAPQRDPSAQPRPAGGLSISGEGLPAEGEDCLVLNVWTPAVGAGGKRPVMFWCHGGGFASGSGSSPDNDGTNLARRGDVVVVTINHRLNVLGFANLSEFSTDFAASGDAGMLDIVQALQWLRANIAEFGGDPNTVTIFGQSGGGRKGLIRTSSRPNSRSIFREKPAPKREAKAREDRASTSPRVLSPARLKARRISSSISSAAKGARAMAAASALGAKTPPSEKRARARAPSGVVAKAARAQKPSASVS